MDFKQNYFELFGLPVVFDIDLKTLAERYLLAQKSAHPDKFVDATEIEKRLAMQWATFINGANTTLKSPLSRAIYMLTLNGIEVANNPDIAADFLMQQIDLREQLEEIEEQAQTNAALAALDTFKAEVASVLSQLEQEIAASFDAKEFSAAEKTVHKMQFMNKLQIAADKVEEKLLDY